MNPACQRRAVYNGPVATPDLAQPLFGPYRLLEPLGEGGMGRVWKAMDIRLERVVALKILKGDDDERRRALVAEAKTACQLQHPNIAVVYDAGELEGAPYIAMEYVEGANLAAEAGRSMPVGRLLSLAIQACKGLHHAHQKGVVHRDIKPDNLVLAPDGTLKILDFGVAKRGLFGSAEATAQAFTLTRETEVGISVGTPSYMSPEQAYGQSQGPSADQFSLGVVLFELASGHHPFRKTAVVETLHAIAKDKAPDLGGLRRDLPRRFAEAVARMLAKDPTGRFPSLAEALEVFEGLELELASGRMPAPARRLPALPWGWMAGGLAGLGLLGGLLWMKPWAGDPDAPASADGMGRGRRVVAVLPVELEGVAPDLAWTGKSLQDVMAMGLLRRRDLMVLDRVRVAEAVGSGGSSLSRLQRELGAEYLVMGSLRASGERLRLSVRVVRGEQGEVVDQLQVQGDPNSLLDMEDELTQRLPALLGGSNGAPAAGPVPRAKLARTRELYTKGLDLIVQGNIRSFELARQLFEEALAGEPDYAPARAGLAWAILELGATGIHLGKADAGLNLDRAVEEGRKAVALDPGLAFAHRVLAEAYHRKGDFPNAHLEAQRSVDLDPADFRALVTLGDAHAYEDGDAERTEARRHYQRAIELRPQDWFAHYRLAVLLQNEGELEEGLRHAEEARRLQPSADYPHLTAALCLLWMGRVEEARTRLEQGLMQNPQARLLILTAAGVAHRSGDCAAFARHHRAIRDAWPAGNPVRELLEGLADDLAGQRNAARDRFLAFLATTRNRDWNGRPKGERRTTSVNLYHMAQAMALGGERDAARQLLEEAERLHPGKRKVASRDPLLRGL